MGVLIDGRWEKDRFDTRKVGDKFVRADSQFRNWLTPDGSQ